MEIFVPVRTILTKSLFFLLQSFFFYLFSPYLFLDASSHFYKRVCLSVGWSVRWSRFCKKINIFEQVRGGKLEESNVITSSYNHFIIVMTYRWPYGPCSYVFDFSASVSLLQDLATAERHLIPARLKHKWYTV